MGIVYLARDVALERPVAIKVLAPALAARRDMRERFLREARIAAQCFHPHIVPIHAVEEADDLAWIVMAYVRGETLADRLRRTGPLDAEELRRLGREVGWALSYAHQRGVVHRDIKPENLLIDASTGRYVIADFGIAQAVDQAITPVGGTVPGTARYMAPEQALGEFVDGRADLYALGVTLFVAATGRAPFDGPSAMALVAQHAAQVAPSVRAFAPTLPLALTRSIDRCLAKRPDDRYSSVGQFLLAIEDDVREQPLATAFLAVRDSARAVRIALTWSVMIGVSGALMIAGEAPRSIGRGILVWMTQSVVLLLIAGACLRGGEALIQIRRLMRRGHAPDEVIRALAGEDRVEEHAGDRVRVAQGGMAQIVLGLSIAFLEGWMTSRSVPMLVDELAQVLTLALPPILLARGVSAVLAVSGGARWIRERVTTPIAAFATRLMGRVRAQPSSGISLVDAPTETLIVRAVQSAVGALPAAHRGTLGDVDAIARSLALRVSALRAHGQEIDAREADALIVRDSDKRAGALDQVRRDREALRHRMQTGMAALESLRLDVLRLAMEGSDGGLTTDLEQVRDVQHRVDAAMDVRRLLYQATPT
ncbi:MAG: serine/threonine protein kinase [Gemmatimonadaceae bacterium]|nr:serine/threonine protein kinase [Gemmatimonadaceae bacterium]